MSNAVKLSEERLRGRGPCSASEASVRDERIRTALSVSPRRSREIEQEA